MFNKDLHQSLKLHIYRALFFVAYKVHYNDYGYIAALMADACL